ncbi:hypothetical protein AZH53_03115 [Methanomicrobiaceae archaeon CYW5]|uniref:Eco57I restriction-modification methylase domain-containing protein n=1 Tax=Methanovulcanius yangii TaxID=1789227 RepID=UPI0029CA2AEA|nr:hypothetical protein [Methanovulcanius yangii]MBT8507419.1 hypothetical protein [Methanovulcanius yangii]
MSDQSVNDWFSELRQNGLLISSPILDSWLPDGPVSLDDQSYERLRDGYLAYLSRSESDRQDHTGLHLWLNTVFERFFGYEQSWWQKHTRIDERFIVVQSGFSGGKLRPDRVLCMKGDSEDPRFLVLIEHEAKRVGMGRGRALYSAFIALLRETGVPLGLLTNGHQFRLVYAGLDFDAWVEWEADRWFEDAAGRRQLAGFLSLCGPLGTFPSGNISFPLLQAVTESRSKQGDLSQVLGERTREAVELLLSAYDASRQTHRELDDILFLKPDGNRISENEAHHALYQASIRLIMRIVVTLFAESRELLPVESDIYYSSYGVEGLYAQLRSALGSGGEDCLHEQQQAWHRLLALFRLIAEGSEYEDLIVPVYGGALFRRGEPSSADVVSRALALYEDRRVIISDAVVYRILWLLKFGEVKVKMGRTTRRIPGVVDFSDLRTEYIGMMYEGLLDYRLKMVTPAEEAVVFLNLGKQPALPFALLRDMEDTPLRNLINELSKEDSSDTGEGEETASDDADLPEPEVDETDEESDEEDASSTETGEGELWQQVFAWACRAVVVSRRVRRTQRMDETIFQAEVEIKARGLLQKVVYPGQMYLIRSTGTRKGSGTFYTKPQLAVPTVHRTLEPLAYEVTPTDEKKVKVPKTPDVILGLRVCDPAMGSGSFLVGASRYLTTALFESLWHHGMINERRAGGTVVTLPFEDPFTRKPYEEFMPESTEDELFDSRLKARLKRHVTERCIYGVDLNPLAVELAKLSLWVETMDRQLPFTYLDHKLRCGNSLVGCWFDRFEEYPVMAWMREGGDKTHSNGIHYRKGVWTDAIKTNLKEQVKPELAAHIRRHAEGQTGLEEWAVDGKVGHTLHNQAVALAERLHAIPIQQSDEREQCYRQRFVENEGLKALHHAFDRWCAVWFWPGDWLDEDGPTPARFYHPTEVFTERVRQIAADQRFFHWELEFPDVFMAGRGGFDAVVGNPPWEISKPKSQEFFSLYDPVYRTRSKQDAISQQKDLFRQNSAIERAWLLYNAGFKAMSNWNKHASFPFGDPDDEAVGGAKISFSRTRTENLGLHAKWRRRRVQQSGYADSAHPFRHQGSADINTYKMFLESAHALCRTGGRIGMIVPSGIYTDNGTKQLRELFLNHCNWEWIFGFENRKKIFDIDSRAKFCPILLEKGNRTEAIQVAFMRHDLEDWERPEDCSLSYPVERVHAFSPKSLSILETQTDRDLAIITKIYDGSVLLGDQGPEGWGIKYAAEFHMTNDSNLFPPRAWWEERGYTPDEYGRWVPSEGEAPELVYRGKKIGEPGDMALPLYEGRMIGQFDFSEKGWVSGTGRSAVWRDIPWDEKVIEPQYLISKSKFKDNPRVSKKFKLGMMDVTSATNSRTAIATGIFDMPCNHKVPTLTPMNYSINNIFQLLSVFNSIPFDYAVRTRLGGTSLIWSVLEEMPTPVQLHTSGERLCQYSVELLLPNQLFAAIWMQIKDDYPNKINRSWKSCWAITPHERLRLRCILDSIIAYFYGLSAEDMGWILRDCGHSTYNIRSLSKEFDPKGFWRVDKDKDPELRHTVLLLKAFLDLKTMGLEAFYAQNDGEGWMIPETITYEVLADGTIAFDTPNGITVPVRKRLGERFLPWQLESSAKESWAECEMHARKILGDEEFEKMIAESERGDFNEVEVSDVQKVLKRAKGKNETFITEKRNQKSLFDY